MNRRILVLSVLFLYVISITTPLIFGNNVKITNEKEIQSTALQDDTQVDHIWPMEKNDAQRTGRSQYDTSHNKGGERWKYFIDIRLETTVVIDKDEMLYVGDFWKKLHAVYPDGTVMWKKNLKGVDSYTAAIGPEAPIVCALIFHFLFMIIAINVLEM